MIILGLNQLPFVPHVAHDSAAAIVRDGEVKAAAEEERFNRVKHSRGYAKDAISYCLGTVHLKDLKDVDGIAAVNNPYNIIPGWHLRRTSRWYLRLLSMVVSAEYARIRTRCTTGVPTYFVDHHLAHASLGFFLSPFEEANILVLDGAGECESVSLFVGRGLQIERRWRINLRYHSLGRAYEMVSKILGFGQHGEGKLMGLAAYGVPRIDLSDTIRVRSRHDYFVDEEKLQRLCRPYAHVVMTKDITQDQMDLAASMQAVLEQGVCGLAKDAFSETGIGNFVVTGGVGLNCCANSRLLNEPFCGQLFVPPAPNDAGLALGGALYLSSVLEGVRPTAPSVPYLGPAFSDAEIIAALSEAGVPFATVSKPEVAAAELLSQGKVIGWFQGRMEVGPRALGARSILADPTIAGISDRINVYIKAREPWRPFGPAVIQESASRYFEGFEKIGESRFMQYTFRVREPYVPILPAIVHIDRTTRPQTVTHDDNPCFYALLREMELRNGHPIVLNTSFNQDAEPIVCTPADAIRCFQRAGLDALVIGNQVVQTRPG